MNNKNGQSKFFTASDENSFAYFTVKNRFPKIYNEYCSGDYEEFVRKNTIKDVFCNKNGKYINSEDENHADINYQRIVKKSVENSKTKLGLEFTENSTLEEFFLKAPFFEAEVLFYHVLLAQKNYHKNKNDFFAGKKDSDYAGKHESYRKELELLFTRSIDYSSIKNEEEKSKQQFDDLHRILTYSLTANTGDLSQLEINRPESVKILQDDTDVIFKFLNKKEYHRFDIICDNSGSELFSDIYLAVFMLLHSYVKKVILHVKAYPYFVSDATLEDFGKLLAVLTKDGRNKRLSEYLHDKKIEVIADKFWTMPTYFDDNEIKKLGLNKSNLIIVKGDLNYRRLVGDKNYNGDGSLKEYCLWHKTPVIAPRVLKSDVLIGVDEVFRTMAYTQDKNYKTDGKWGVIQTTLNGDGTNSKKKQQLKRVWNHNKKAKIEKKEKNNSQKFTKFTLFNGILFGILLLIVLNLAGLLITYYKISKIPENPVYQVQGTASKTNSDKDESNLTEQEDNKKNVAITPISFGSVDFALMLTGLVIFISATVIVPEVIMEKKVKDNVEKFGRETIEIETRNHIKSEIDKVRNELNKTDAHLSRMVALAVSEKYPVWSIGWAFRSLKRYQKLDSTQVGFEDYSDFVDFLRNRVVSTSIRNFETKINEIEKSVEKTTIKKQAWNAMVTEQKDNNEEYKLESVRAAIRAVKDIIDLDYSVYKDKYSKIDDYAKEILKKFCCITADFCRLLCASLINFYPQEINGKLASEEDKDGCKVLLREILKISDYGIKGKSAKNEDVKSDFRKKLEREFADIKSQQDFCLLNNDTKNQDSEKSFFQHTDTSFIK